MDGPDASAGCCERTVGGDDHRGATVHHAAHDVPVIRHFGPRPVHNRIRAVILDGPDRQILRFAGEEQDAARTGRVRDGAQNDVGQALRVRRPRQRTQELMRADRIDPSRPGRTDRVGGARGARARASRCAPRNPNSASAGTPTAACVREASRARCRRRGRRPPRGRTRRSSEVGFPRPARSLGEGSALPSRVVRALAPTTPESVRAVPRSFPVRPPPTCDATPAPGARSGPSSGPAARTGSCSGRRSCR